MFRENKPKHMTDLETIIGSGVRLEGNFVAEGNVIIRGQIKGSVETKNDLRIEAGALVEADSKAKNILLAGEVKGNLKAEEKVSFLKTGRLFGNVECKVLSIEEGAVFNGQCLTGEKKVSEE